MHAVLTRFHRAQSGQVTAWFVGSFILFLALFAFTVDLGFWLLERRHAQNDVDAAVLAGVQELPLADPQAAADAAQDWLNRNSRTVTEVSECAIDPSLNPDENYSLVLDGFAFADIDEDGDYERLRACIRRDGFIFFSALLEVTGIKVPAVAAAKVDELEDPGNFAIFANCANESDPAVLEIPGQNAEVIGWVHSNCDLKLNGSDLTFDGGPVTCDDGPFEESGSNHTFLDSAPFCPGQDEIAMPIPRPDTWLEVWDPGTNDWVPGVCDQEYVGGIDLGGDVAAGVHCATGKIVINGVDSFPGDGVTTIDDHVTFISSVEINISGPVDVQDVQPAWTTSGGDPILLFSNGDATPAIDVSAQGVEWTGVIYAPEGQVTFAGSDGAGTSEFVLHSSIIADTVIMSGSNWVLNGIVDSAGSSVFELVLVE